MRIAIIGAGFCGLATACYLSKTAGHEIDLFDQKGVGSGASGASAGLLHCFAGAHSKLNWRAHEAIEAAKELIDIAEKALNEPVSKVQGMLRPAITEMQKEDFYKCAQNHPDEVLWMTPEECLKKFPQLLPHPGIFIKNTVALQSEKYLRGLFIAAQRNGVRWVVNKISSLAELDQYDKIIIATGADTSSIKELAQIPLTLFKGQALKLQWPDNIPLLPFPINSQAYLLMNPDGKSCTAGATYERVFENGLPNREVAIKEILPKINAFLPIFKESDVLDCKSGIRATTPSKRPMAEKINEKTWIITGMGAKGLLYHSLLAKEIAEITDY